MDRNDNQLVPLNSHICQVAAGSLGNQLPREQRRLVDRRLLPLPLVPAEYLPTMNRLWGLCPDTTTRRLRPVVPVYAEDKPPGETFQPAQRVWLRLPGRYRGIDPVAHFERGDRDVKNSFGRPF